MEYAGIEELCRELLAMQPHRWNRHRLKVYAEPLGKNFYLVNPGGRPLPPDVELSLAKKGIRTGWKANAPIYPCAVNLLELYLAVDFHS